MRTNLLRTRRNCNAHCPAPRRRPYRPFVERLEDRWMPSTYTWVSNTDGNWFDAGNWRDQNNHPGVPTINDNASVPVQASGLTITIDGDTAAHSLSDGARLVVQNGGSLRVATDSSTGELDLDAGCTLYVPGSSRVTVGNANYPSILAGTIEVGDFSTLTLTNLRLTGTIDNPSPKDHSTVNLSGGQINPGAQLNGPGQYVQIGGGGLGALALNTDLTVQNLRLDVAGSLTGSATLTVTGSLDWAQGTLANAGGTEVASGAVLNVIGGGTVSSSTLTNDGTATWPVGAGSLNLDSLARFHNVGTMDVQNHALFMNGQGRLDNDGTLTVEPGQGTARCGSVLNNTGLVNVPSGAMFAVQNANVVSTGTVAVDGEFDMASQATYTFNAGAITGAGLVYLSNDNATLAINTPLTLTNFTEEAGRVNVNLTDPDRLTVTGVFNFAGGAVNGPGGFTFPTGAAFNWTGGTVSNSITVQSGATLTISGAGNKTLSGGTLNVAGSGTWTDTGAINFNGSGDALNITGTFAVQTDARTPGTGGSINNAGLFTKDSPGGTGTTSVSPAFNNSGTVVVNTGTLQLTGGGAANNSAIFDTAAGADLVFSGGSYDLNDGTQFTAAGAVQVAGATVNVLGNVTAPDFALSSGTLTGSGSLTVRSGNFDWTGGSIANLTGDLEIAADATLTIEGNGNKTLNGHTINIDGAATWQDSGSINLSGTNPTINILADGSFTILNDQTMSGSGYFNNYGTLTKSPGVDKTTIAAGVAFVNNGTVNVASGWLEIDNYTQYAGLTAVSGSILGSTGAVAIDGGELAGTGTVRANVTVDLGGIVSPGGDGAVGELTIEGNYTQNALGVLNLDVAGAVTPGSDYDWLNVTGNVTLGGTLNVNFLYTPAVGDSYVAITAGGAAGIQGSFAQVNVSNLDPSLTVTMTYDPADVTLSVTSSPSTGQGSFGGRPASQVGTGSAAADAYFGTLGRSHDAPVDDLDFLLM